MMWMYFVYHSAQTLESFGPVSLDLTYRFQLQSDREGVKE